MKYKEYTKKYVETLYRNIEGIKKERNEILKQVNKLDNDAYRCILEYRIASVTRVLEYMHTKLNITSGKDLETYLVHCLNKLNGNIDGIELDLGEVGSKLTVIDGEELMWDK